MAKITYTSEEVPQFELLKSGPYAFEVVGCDVGIQNGGKTNGCDKVELKLMLFTDAKFEKKVGTISRLMIFPQTRDAGINSLLQGHINAFIKSAGIEAEMGEELELDEHSCLRRRGWVNITQKQVKRGGVAQFVDGDNKKPELRNEVDRFITDKGRIERAPAAVEDTEEKPF